MQKRDGSVRALSPILRGQQNPAVRHADSELYCWYEAASALGGTHWLASAQARLGTLSMLVSQGHTDM